MKCQACGAEDAQHELTEIVDGRAQTMFFCANCLPDRVRGAAAPAQVAISAFQKDGNDLHLWLTVNEQVARSDAVLRLAEGVEITFPVEEGTSYTFEDKAGEVRPDCSGDLVIHIKIKEDYSHL